MYCHPAVFSLSFAALLLHSISSRLALAVQISDLFFWNLSFTSLFWLLLGIHKIPRELEVLSKACKSNEREVGEWAGEKSFPLPCHSLPNGSLTPFKSFLRQKASEEERGGESPACNGLLFLTWCGRSRPQADSSLSRSPSFSCFLFLSLVSHSSGAFGLLSRSPELVNSSESTGHLKQIRSVIATQRPMMDGGLYLQQN